MIWMNSRRIIRRLLKKMNILGKRTCVLKKKLLKLKPNMKKFQPMLRNLTKAKKKLHDLLKFQNNDKNKFGLSFDENSAKKVSKKSTLEEVFIKKQPSFKNSHNSNKDRVFNKSSQPNKSNYYLNNKISYSKRQNDRFPTQNISNSRNSYSKGNNLRTYHH